MTLEQIKEKLTEDLRYEAKEATSYTEWTHFIKEIASWLTRIELATKQEELEKVAYEINMEDEEYWEEIIKELKAKDD